MKQSVLRILVHRLPKILCGGCCFAAQNVFTGESKPAVSHKDSSGSHCHNALMPLMPKIICLSVFTALSGVYGI